MKTCAHGSYALGVTGYPLGHSLSPRLHTAALRASGLQGEYRLYPIPPLPAGQEALEALIVSLRNGRLDGINVTIPHKQGVIPYLDVLTPSALQIGAVNTIFRRDGRLIGDNTDAPGFMADLYKKFPEPSISQSALVLGAGGSARAVVFALLTAGWHVTIAARRPEKAREIINGSTFRNEQCAVIGLESLPEYIRNIAHFQREERDKKTSRVHQPLFLIVNTTPVGMLPDIEFSPWPKDLLFPIGAFVYDLVYNPVDTALVSAARSAGLAAASGLGMLIEQAALAFERWTGIRPSIETLRQEVTTTVEVSSRLEL
jgi:shikimate dehydrogenase